MYFLHDFPGHYGTLGLLKIYSIEGIEVLDSRFDFPVSIKIEYDCEGRFRDLGGSVNFNASFDELNLNEDNLLFPRRDDDFRDFRESKKQGKPLLSKEY